jgi:cellulose synthase/poly-beta-1,6-N-acetylglucosamine synthase-like glycosyltransferase
MDINPPGLVIEDFNMTFELHHKKLGKIAHHRNMYAITQDPDNFRDYYRQVTRWDLGFWQTVQRHGFFWSPFWLALGIYIVEVMLGSVILLLIPIIMLIVSLPDLTGGVVLAWPWFVALYTPLAAVFSWQLLLYGVFLPDYLLSVITAMVQRRPEYLWHGLGFIFLRYIDAWLYLYTFPKALITYSSGEWKSPTRR